MSIRTKQASRSAKAKGYRFEKDLEQMLRSRGLPAKRAFASRGSSLGETDDVDLVIDTYRAQAKVRKTIAKTVQKDFLPVEGVDIQFIRHTNNGDFAVIRTGLLAELLLARHNLLAYLALQELQGKIGVPEGG